MSMREHLLSRHVDLEMHPVWIDEQNEIATFPMFVTTGAYSGFLQYQRWGSKDVDNDRTAGKYFCLRTPGMSSFWGLETLHLSQTVVITEGVFDAARLAKAGVSSLAMCAGTMSNDMVRLLRVLSVRRRIVSACDGDKSGLRLKKVVPDAFICSEGHDPADIPDDEFQDLLDFTRSHERTSVPAFR